MPALFIYPEEFTLEAGGVLPGFQLAYETWGTLSPEADNAVWICHALTANANVEDWWPGMIKPGGAFDPAKDFIICVNVPGSCYGSTGPLSISPATGEPWYHHFPQLTLRDIVRMYDLLRESLGIRKIKILTGGSLGGQQAVEWAIENPSLVQRLVLLATNARHSPWGIAFNEAQRLAILADETWQLKNEDAGKAGMKAARATALLSYRNPEMYNSTQQGEPGLLDHFPASSYQQYQGDKLCKRFNAFSYYFLSKTMDTHDVGRNRGGITAALRKITAETLVIGITTDLLFPPAESEVLASCIPRARLHFIDSPYGHDGFLTETIRVSSLIRYSFQLIPA